MKMSIIAVALLSSFSASAAVDLSNCNNANNNVVGCITSNFNKVDAAITETKGVALDALGSAESAHDRIGAVVTEVNYHTKAIIGNAMDIYKTNQEVAGVKDVAVKASENAANAIKGVADTNTRVDEAIASTALVGAQASRAQSTADRAEAKVDMNTASIGKVNERVDLVEQDVSGIRHDVDTNTQAIYAHGNALKQHGETLDNHDKRIGSLEQQMNGFKSDLADLQDEVKAVGAMSMAAANLHYVGVENSYAMSLGQYRSATALAAGAQFNVNEKTAVTVQLATDFTGSLGGAVGVHGRW